jgi:hypothetical protein
MATRASVTPSQASHLPSQTRNELYSSLLSGTGILNIESTLSHELQRSGWVDNLRQYMMQLLRSGEATSVDELMAKVSEKMKADRGHVNGNGVNGVNGVNGTNGHSADEDVDLKIPERAIREGAKTIRKELEKVCDINMDAGNIG